jgi:hypothetical protein
MDDVESDYGWLPVPKGSVRQKTRGAIAAQMWNDYPVACRGQQRGDVDIAVNVVRPAVQKDHGRAIDGAASAYPTLRRPASICLVGGTADLSYESVSKVRLAMKDMVKRMVAEEYLTTNMAEGLKTPKTARRSDRSRLRRVSLAEYVRAWTVLDERERIAFDLVTFCGLRESEAYGLRNGDLFQ